MKFYKALLNEDTQEIKKYIDNNNDYKYLKAAYDGDLETLQEADKEHLVKIRDDDFKNIIHYANMGWKLEVLEYLEKIGIQATPRWQNIVANKSASCIRSVS